MASQQIEEVADLLRAAETLFTDGRFDEAAKTFERAAALQPNDDAVTCTNWGLSLALGGHLGKAVEIYRRAVKAKPDYATAYYQWGDVLTRQGKYEKAMEKYQRAAELDPANALAFHGWGSSLVYLGRDAEAVDQYSHAAALDPGNAMIQNSWGAALANSNRSAEATEKYRRATELKPDYGAVYRNWGLALAALGDDVGAIEMFRRAAELGETNVYDLWGYALSRLKQDVEAIEQFSRAAEINPNDVVLLIWWGAALATIGRHDEAIAMYAKAIAIDPNNSSACYNWGVALAAQSKFDEAIEKYRCAANLDPNSDNICYGWGIALAGQRQFDEAILQFRHATELNPKGAAAFHSWGLALAAQHKYGAAIEQYQKAVDVDPKNVAAYLDWGAALANQGRYREAIDVTSRVMEYDRDYAYAYHNVAYFRWKKGDYKTSWPAWDAAIESYRKTTAKKRKERDADFFSNYGTVLHEQIGDLKQAEEVLLEGLAIDPNHTDILMRLGALYTDRYRGPGRERAENWAADFWEARHYLERAEQELRRRVAVKADAASLQKLGELLLMTENYDEAKVELEKAHQLDADDASLCNSLGVVCSRIEDYHRAAEHYAAALKHSPGDLAFWSNLAETYLKLEKRDRAEKEYRKILTIAEDHIDSQIGLGEVYTAMADAGDSELYEVALRHYDHAIQLAQSCAGSKRVAPKELATMYYARGYAAVQAYEAQGALGGGESLLTKALVDFKSCVQSDPEHYKGDRAKRKILDRRKTFSADWLTRKLAPWFILVPAVTILVEAQMAHYQMMAGVAKIEVGEYSALTFGALMFIVIGLFLPQIQKLKGAGIELEKSPVNQITTTAGLGIKK